jgi:hypothetical protein
MPHMPYVYIERVSTSITDALIVRKCCRSCERSVCCARSSARLAASATRSASRCCRLPARTGHQEITAKTVTVAPQLACKLECKVELARGACKWGAFDDSLPLLELGRLPHGDEHGF